MTVEQLIEKLKNMPLHYEVTLFDNDEGSGSWVVIDDLDTWMEGSVMLKSTDQK